MVALIIIRFSIRNYMEMNRKNIGILMAAGYTTGQMNAAVVLEMCVITFFGVIFGIALGSLGSSFIGSFQGMMLGVSWNQTFHFGAAAISAGIVFFIVLTVAYFGGRVYKKISVLHALRGGIDTHNFKRNYFPFEKSRLPVNLCLSGKNLLFEKGKNLSIFFIVALLAFSSCVGFGMYDNFVKNQNALLCLVGIESGDFYMASTPGDFDEIGRTLESWREIDSVLYYNSISLHLESQSKETECSCDIWRNPELVRNETVVSGRLPRYENEIMLSTGIAKVLKVKEGDTVYVTGLGERMPFLISGIDQKITNMGLKAMLTEEGSKALNGSTSSSFIYVYVKEGEDKEEIIKRVSAEFPQAEVLDSQVQTDDIMGGIKAAMIAICAVFVTITVFVVAMVELLLIKSKVIKERKNFGIYKALGFTTGELMIQTIMINLPVIAAGALAGAVLSRYFMEPLVVLFLSFSEIKSCPFTVKIFWMIVTVAGILATAVAASFISSMKIRKIGPVDMLSEE